MSGGSYNYLCDKDAKELVEHDYYLRQMAEDLMTHWPQSHAAHDTRQLVELIDIFTKLIDDKRKRLEDVWHAQEWWQSNDYSKEQVTQTIWDYEHPKPDEIS